MELTVYLQTVWNHMISSFLDISSYTLCARCRCLLAAFVGIHGCHCPWYCDNGIWYLPHSYILMMRMGFLWHAISTYSSLCNVTPYSVKIDTLPSSAVLPTLISDVGTSCNVSASAAFLESCGNGSVVTHLPLQDPQLVICNFLSNILNIGGPNFVLYISLS